MRHRCLLKAERLLDNMMMPVRRSLHHAVFELTDVRAINNLNSLVVTTIDATK
jgi:hypothetical protein